MVPSILCLDQLAAQLLASKINIENGVSTCEPIETTIGYAADTVLRYALYNGPIWNITI
jgi:hypothetical protein